jgi:hypothetical protein
MKNKIILGVILVFAVMQLFRIEKVEYEEPTENGITMYESPSKQVTQLLDETCLNCHSNQITYPWYSEIAPVSWWIADHIEEGREHLNFSEWGQYSAAKKEHKAEESWEEIEEKEMPLESYVVAHSEADLTAEEREILIKYFKSLQAKYNNAS